VIEDSEEELTNTTEEIRLRPWGKRDLAEMTVMWNEVIDEGANIPFTEPFTEDMLEQLIREEGTAVCAVRKNKVTPGNVPGNATVNAPGSSGIDTGEDELVGFYIEGANLPGRCSSIANATYIVRKDHRGQHIGEMLVRDSLRTAKERGFRMMQFNGVVDSNIHARHLYARCGFREVGVIPKGFRVKDGHYEDMHIMVKEFDS